ncbi:hypothetical protein [Acidithiobacillus albertensis]|uniref:hypothetical protein n=1 Tax=Acidithiobacillus albertensis TaxID=119978 RepID=UPI001C07B099|nr:hypothetical protein [Acidithiobacillus albertensis]MBU2741262.1 hypothetical protein [Acidithiobacillus albertensis]
MSKQSNSSVKQQAKAFQEQVLSLLAEKPMSTKEIMSVTGARQGAVRSALSALLHGDRAMALGGKPVLYKKLTDKPCAQFVSNVSAGYTGNRHPYFRPGSYTAPNFTRVPMFMAAGIDRATRDFDTMAYD